MRQIITFTKFESRVYKYRYIVLAMPHKNL